MASMRSRVKIFKTYVNSQGSRWLTSNSNVGRQRQENLKSKSSHINGLIQRFCLNKVKEQLMVIPNISLGTPHTCEHTLTHVFKPHQHTHHTHGIEKVKRKRKKENRHTPSHLYKNKNINYKAEMNVFIFLRGQAQTA